MAWNRNEFVLRLSLNEITQSPTMLFAKLYSCIVWHFTYLFRVLFGFFFLAFFVWFFFSFWLAFNFNAAFGMPLTYGLDCAPRVCIYINHHRLTGEQCATISFNEQYSFSVRVIRWPKQKNKITTTTAHTMF